MLMNLFRVAKIWGNTFSFLKVKQPCMRATRHAPKMCAVVQMEASEEILQHLKLLGDGKVSKFEERQNKVDG